MLEQTKISCLNKQRFITQSLVFIYNISKLQGMRETITLLHIAFKIEVQQFLDLLNQREVKEGKKKNKNG